MGRHCCVKDCKTGVKLPSHMFPKNVNLMYKWKEAIYADNIERLTDDQLRKCVVCYRHFADSDYESMYRLRRLKPGAIPSLYLPNHDNSQANNDNNSETNNSKNNTNKSDAEDSIKNVNRKEFQMEITTDPIVEKIEIIEIIEEEQSLTKVLQKTNNLLNGNPSMPSSPESETLSELKLEEPRLSEPSGKPLESAEFVKSKILEPMHPKAKLSESRSPRSGSSLAKNSTRSLLELHNLLQGKYFHKFTPRTWKLYKLCCMLKKKQEAVAKRQLSFRERIRQAKQYGKSLAIGKLLSSLTPIQRTFLQMQIKATKYAPKDRHFTLEEKIAALSIMKQSSKCYQYLTQVFNLPSVRALQSILQKINIYPGPMTFINQCLKKRVRLMKEKDKVCILMWDEMLLQPHLDYDTRKKHILGFEDFGQMRCARFADHALVFMIRGIQNGWKFPLAYYFCDGAAKSDQLVKWMKTVAKIIIDSGLHLVALTCNDTKRNMTAVNKLKLESAKLKSKRGELYYGDITINEQDIIPLYDPSHLIKGVRNNLLNSDLEFDCTGEEGEERKFASWEIIEQAYHMDLTHSIYRLMPKITMEHIIKSKIKRRKAKNAAQVFSTTMGGFIYHHTKLDGCVNTINGPLKMPKKEGRDTAEIVFFFDQLFDSVNGHTLKPEKLLRVAVSYNSSHLEFWQTAIQKLQRMCFIDSKSKSPLRDSTVLKNWIYTLKGFRKLWVILKKYEFKYLKPRILNQDSLRLFFGQIKSLSKRYNNPTCAEFESSFKTLLINNLSSPRTVENNSENKIDGSLLFTLKKLIYRAERRNENGMTENLQISDMEIDKKCFGTTRNYINICNSIAARILNDSRIKGCNICKNLLTSTVKSDLVSNEHLLKMFKDADDILKQKMSNICYMHHTALMLETELYMQMDLHWLNCQRHNISLKELVISYMIVFYIYKWCDGINDILTGEHEDLS